MKRLSLSILILICCALPAMAKHIIGGEIRYTYLSPGTAANSKNYQITLILFRGNDIGGAALAPSYVIGIYNNDNNQKVIGNAANSNWLITKSTGDLSVPILFPSCIQNPPTLNYTYAVYTMTIELPDNRNGYTATYQTCCRIDGLQNMANSTGSTYSTSIPGLNQLPTGNDSSPAFGVPVNVICENSPFTLNFSAADPDTRDSLVYSFCDAWNGGAAVDAGFNNPAPPPYGFASYNFSYSGANPFGTGATIDSKTGIITGMAPDIGKYVVSVCITVYRDGVRIASHKKDLIVEVNDCKVTAANPMPDFVTCNGFEVQFSHTSTGANTVFWDFGVASLTDDTSNVSNPTYTYADTGTYNVKFVINRGEGCTDSVIRKVGVYPGFSAGFTTAGVCYLNPVQFTDTTKARYGTVNSWSWNFGDLTTLADTSHNQNPRWTYAGAGPKTINFIVTSSKGCRDTVTHVIDMLDKPIITLDFKDTLICRNDNVQLQASGTGVFSWTPNVSITGANTATPTVSPATTTTYHVQLDDQGCVNTDSVKVRVVNFVTLNVMPDTTICATDPAQLRIVSDGLRYAWTPAGSLNNPTIQNPVALAGISDTYTVTATIGGCSTTRSIGVTAVPYPVANAGVDPTMCYNVPIQLNGSHNGSSFTWSPTTYLTNANTLTPTANPPSTRQYVLSSFDTRGCPKPGKDTVLVTVLPKILPWAGRDTSVIVNQPLQFNATGGASYQWFPSTGLSSTVIANPIGTYGANIDSIRYKVLVFNEVGCVDSAFVTVRVFKTVPSVFVATAFTPNGDGRNDIIAPVAVGMKQINYFSVYNRWGQLVFKTSVNGAGWDGRIKGVMQSTNVFVWMVSAVDYLGNPYFKKGTVTLIR